MHLRRTIGTVALLTMIAAACGSDSKSTATTAAPAQPTTTASSATTPAATDTTPAATDTTPPGTDTATTAAAAANPLAAFGEDPSKADPALVAKALGPVKPSDADSWSIVLAAIARADQKPDQATIDKALECWHAQSCDTGSGGKLVFGYADGGGDTVNVWRG